MGSTSEFCCNNTDLEKISTVGLSLSDVLSPQVAGYFSGNSVRALLVQTLAYF